MSWSKVNGWRDHRFQNLIAESLLMPLGALTHRAMDKALQATLERAEMQSRKAAHYREPKELIAEMLAQVHDVNGHQTTLANFREIRRLRRR